MTRQCVLAFDLANRVPPTLVPMLRSMTIAVAAAQKDAHVMRR